ncbi:MAG: hypothetical protein ACE5KP_04395 [Dehalococcoidales bacterium]
MTTLSDELLSAHFGFLGATHDAEELSKLGIRWDRPHPGPFIWGRIERQKGEYDWQEMDRYVWQAQDYGFATLATIWPFAGWDQANWGGAGTGGIVFEREMGKERRKPYDMEAYRTFVSSLVERYDGDGDNDMPGLKFPIKHWEAGNEPSMQEGFNSFFNGSPEDYLEVLKVTYQAVKAADPEAKVLHAGMAGMEPQMVSFWEPVLEKGSQYFDIANIHSIGASDELNVPRFTELLAKYGIDKPIWVTEAQHRSGPSFDGRDISPEEQARILVKSYILSFGLEVDKIFYTSFKAPSFAPEEFQQSALIVGPDEKRPAYYALATMISKLDGFTSAEKLNEGQYAFQVNGEKIYVLWGTGSIPTGAAGGILVTDMYGREITGDTSTIELSQSPVYVEGDFSIQPEPGPPKSVKEPTGEQWQEEEVLIPGTYCDADVVQIDDGRFRMYYSMEPEAAGFEGQVYSAVSGDGIKWTQEDGIRLKWATFPSVIGLPVAHVPKMPSGETARWRMYFQGSPTDAGPTPETGIVSAISADGLDWTIEEGFRIETGRQGEYDAQNVAAPTVIELADGTYLMVYRGSSGENRFGKTDPFSGKAAPIDYLISATSPDGLNWMPRSVVVDSRNEAMRDQIDGPELVMDGETIKLYCNSYEGVYVLTLDRNGKALTSPDLVLSAQGYHAPSDVTVIRIAGVWRMYYGIHTEGIYSARRLE